MDTESVITGRRMQDVRVVVAQRGGGLFQVIGHEAGDYTLLTLDERTWHVRQTAGGLWTGEVGSGADAGA